MDVCSEEALGKGVDSHEADISAVLIYLQKQLDDFSNLSDTFCSALLRITGQHVSVFHSLLV